MFKLQRTKRRILQKAENYEDNQIKTPEMKNAIAVIKKLIAKSNSWF